MVLWSLVFPDANSQIQLHSLGLKFSQPEAALKQAAVNRVSHSFAEKQTSPLGVLNIKSRLLEISTTINYLSVP